MSYTDNLKYESPQGIKTELILIRLTPEEKSLLAEQAKKIGISMSAMVRLMLAQYAGTDLRFLPK